MMMVWHGKHFSITGHYKGYPTDTCGLHLKRIHSFQTKFYYSHICIGSINEDFTDDKSSFVEVMAWHRMAHQIMLIKFYDAIASPVSNELPNLRWRLIYTRPEFHDDVIKWKHFPRYMPLRGESTGHRLIPLIKASDAELWCFLWSGPEPTVDQTMETPVIWDPIAFIMTSLQCSILFDF